MTENRDARYIRSHSQQSTQPPSQCSSSFMERVNKIFQASKATAAKESPSVKERLRTISPFLQKKLEALKTARTTRVRLFEKLKGNETGPWSTTRRKEEKHAAELAAMKLSTTVNRYLREVFAKMRSGKCNKPRPVLGNIDLSQLLAFTQCSHCNAVGLTLLTSSTKENLSPKFLEKVKMLLPSRPCSTPPLPPKPSITSVHDGQASPDPKDYHSHDNELSMVLYADEKEVADAEKKLSLPDISLIPMEGSLESSLASIDPSADPQPVPPLKKPEVSKDQSDWDRSTDCKTPACDVSSQSYRRPSPVPRLNISELLPMKKLAAGKLNYSGVERKAGNLGSVEVLQGSPLFVKKDGKALHTMEKLVGLFKVRIHKAFDMVFLSRVPKQRQLADQSLTFEFSREEESLSASGTLTGTFRGQERLCNISAIDPRDAKFTEDSFVFEYDHKPEVSSTVKTAFRILFSRLEKVVSKRKLRGFYCIAGL